MPHFKTDYPGFNNTRLLSGSAIKTSLTAATEHMENLFSYQSRSSRFTESQSHRAHKSSAPDGRVWICLTKALFTQSAKVFFCRICTLSHLTLLLIYVLLPYFKLFMLFIIATITHGRAVQCAAGHSFYLI